MKTLCSLLLLAASAGAALAQSPAPKPSPAQCPSGPLLNPLPNNIQWTVAYSSAPEGQGSKADENAPSAKPTPKVYASKVEVGQSVGDVRHVVTTYGNGNKMDVWKRSRTRRTRAAPVDNSKMDIWERDGSQYVMNTGWKVPVVTDASPDDLYEDMGWVSPQNFQSIAKYNGVDCMVFRDKVTPPGTARGVALPESAKVQALAVIELDRRLPVVVQIGQEVTNFKFQTLEPGFVLTPPPEVDAALVARAQQAQATMRRAVHP